MKTWMKSTACICVSSEHAEVQPGYWLFKARGRSLTFHVRICWHGGVGGSAAQVWLWMSAGGAFILLPRGWNITRGHDPRLVPHSEILHLLAVWKPTIHPDSWADPEAFKSRMTRWHGVVNSTLMGLTVVYMLSRTAWCSKGQGYSTNPKRFLSESKREVQNCHSDQM